jgi:hypothetical protein
MIINDSDDCHICLFKHINSSIRYSVQWRETHFVVCTFLNGKLKQCTLSQKELISHNYTHCWLLSCLHGKSFPLKSDVVVIATPLTKHFFNIVAKEDPAWLYYSFETYHMHLSQVSVSVLATAIKSCSQSGIGCKVIPHKKCKKEMIISTIIEHFISERNRYILTSRAKFSKSATSSSHNSIYSFVDLMELLYGQEIATMLRETPFTISPQVNQEIISSDELSWFNESIEELVRRLHSFSMDTVISHVKKIPFHHRPTYNPRSRCKTLNSLVDHVLRRVSDLLSLQMVPICELALALDPHSMFEEEPSREVY